MNDSDPTKVNVGVKNALKARLKSSTLKQANCSGAAGLFKVEKPAKFEKPKANKAK